MTFSDIMAGVITVWLVPLTGWVHTIDKAQEGNNKEVTATLKAIHEDVKMIKERLLDVPRHD